jgi:hypothetical protein
MIHVVDVHDERSPGLHHESLQSIVLGRIVVLSFGGFWSLGTPRVCVLDSETGTARICSRSSLEELGEDDAAAATAKNRKRKEEEERIIVDVMHRVGLGKARMRFFG